jgi:hypothetical protein
VDPIWTVGEAVSLPADLEVTGPVRIEAGVPGRPGRMEYDRLTCTYHWRRIGGGVRGPVVGFSRQSRRRLMRLLGTVRTEQMGQGWFATLTYHNAYPERGDVKRDLRALQDRLRRLDPEAAMIWRLEAQERGAPHYHLLIWSNLLRPKWLRDNWTEVVGERTSEWHARYGCDVQPMRSWAKLRAYCAKYVAKEVSDGLEWGRRWAAWGALSTDPLDMRMLTESEAVEVKRLCRRLLRAQARARGESRRQSYRGIRVEFATWIGGSASTLWSMVAWAMDRSPPEHCDGR